MAKSKQEWEEIDSWSHERLLARIKVLSREIEGVYAADIAATVESSQRLSDKADEMVYILLMLLKSVIKQKKWSGISPIDLFCGVYQECTGYVWAAVHSRFCESKQLVETFKKAGKDEKEFIKPKLVSRGFIG